MRKLVSIGSDDLIALGLGFAVFLFHAVQIPVVARAAIFHRSNLAFDFDINRFVSLWCVSPYSESDNDAAYAIRHPLAISMRLLCMPLVQAGVDSHIAACGIGAICAALSTALIYKIARTLEIDNSLAIAFAALWSVSTTSLVLGVLPEAYGLALVGLTYQFLLTARWVNGRVPSFAARIGVATANFGITITNVLLCGLAELLCRISREPLRKALRGTIGFSVAVSLVTVVLTVASLSMWPAETIDSPKNAVRQMYWSAAAYNPDQRQDVGNVAWEFAATSFAAPAMAHFPSGVPSEPYLWDFRGQDYSALGWVAVLGWLALLVFGTVAAARDRERWLLWTLAAVWIGFNIALHSYWQFRGSVFIYGGHPHIAFLMLALAGAARTKNPHSYAVLVAVVVLLLAVNNAPMYLRLSELN